MRILGDSNITAADITATNIITSSLTNKLKTFSLEDNMRTIAGSTVIDFTFNSTVPNLTAIGLCGTNLTSNAVITLSYSDTDINSPDAPIVLPLFSSLNQIFFLASTLNKKYWRISIVDSSLSTLFIGYLYIGKYFQIPAVEFGHAPSLDLFSTPSVTPTGQGYGNKIYNALPLDFTMFLEYAELVEFLAILQEKQNIDPVLLVEYETDYGKVLYRPKYGVLIQESTPFPMSESPLVYAISSRLEERF